MGFFKSLGGFLGGVGRGALGLPPSTSAGSTGAPNTAPVGGGPVTSLSTSTAPTGPNQIGQFINQLGKSSLETLATRGTNLMADKMFAGAEQKLRGKNQRSYMNAAYPGTNPWEHLGGATGSAGGGTVAAQISSMPGLKSANLQFQKQPAEIEGIRSASRKDIYHGDKLRMEGNMVEPLAQTLMKFQKAKTKETFAATKLTLQKLITEISKSKEVQANAELASELAKYSKWLAPLEVGVKGSKILSPFMALPFFKPIQRLLNKTPFVEKKN